MSVELEALRIERNKLLEKSDWTQSNDSPLSDTKKTEWATYRQALRDITKTASPKIRTQAPYFNSLDPSSVTFPTKPS
tara:strand:+ start:373 stop:606 length:234 start_codon:yes stop_codon:yes gene_type:complete